MAIWRNIGLKKWGSLVALSWIPKVSLGVFGVSGMPRSGLWRSWSPTSNWCIFALRGIGKSLGLLLSFTLVPDMLGVNNSRRTLRKFQALVMSHGLCSAISIVLWRSMK